MSATTEMTTDKLADSLHRLVKHALDSGAAGSIAEAEAMFRGFRLSVEFDPAGATDPAHQAALLTTVALARRVFLGGVDVTGALDTELVVSMPLGSTLAEAVVALGGRTNGNSEVCPTIVIGGGSGTRRPDFCVRTAVAGWRGGAVPIDSKLQPVGPAGIPLTGMLAAALAVNEAYLHVSGDASIAGHRTTGLSLWRPGADVDWLNEDETEPALTFLPTKLWVIGLGHLGQAYLWGLGLLPYCSPAEVSLVLQDIDPITRSTESTSVLSDATMIGRKKTRVMADWAERRGFSASVQERLFAADFSRQQSEPAIALCGLDNAIGRQALDQVGFDLVVEAGLGKGHRDFRRMRLHTLPGRRRASEIWRGTSVGENVEEQPAYKRLLADGSVDQCGMTLLAGKAVGAPFVGAAAASLALAEVLRLLHGGRLHQLVDLDLLDLDHRVTSLHPGDFSRFNPGFAKAASLG